MDPELRIQQLEQQVARQTTSLAEWQALAEKRGKKLNDLQRDLDVALKEAASSNVRLQAAEQELTQKRATLSAVLVALRQIEGVGEAERAARREAAQLRLEQARKELERLDVG